MEVAASTEQSADAVRCQFLLSTNGTAGEKKQKTDRRRTNQTKNNGKKRKFGIPDTMINTAS